MKEESPFACTLHALRMYPISGASYTVVKLGEVESVLDHYDLTGQLDTQMPDLKKYKKEKNGYIYYGE